MKNSVLKTKVGTIILSFCVATSAMLASLAFARGDGKFGPRVTNNKSKGPINRRTILGEGSFYNNDGVSNKTANCASVLDKKYQKNTRSMALRVIRFP